MKFTGTLPLFAVKCLIWDPILYHFKKYRKNETPLRHSLSVGSTWIFEIHEETYVSETS